MKRKKLSGERIAKIDKTRRRGPYRCALCREHGHRQDKCPNAHKLQTILDSLPGEIALHSLVPEHFQVLAVINGQTGEALLGAIHGAQKMVDRGLPYNSSIVNAYTELATRAAKIPARVIRAALEAYEALRKADAAYNKAIAPIRDVLGHKAPVKNWRHPLSQKTIVSELK